MSCDERFKNFRKKKKTNPRIISDDIYRYIANNSETGLDLKQIAECFRLYKQLVTDLYMSPYAEEDMTIILPHLGNFYLRKWSGRKGGSTYKLFDKNVVLKSRGKLADLAPTILKIIEEEKPVEMTGENLIIERKDK